MGIDPRPWPSLYTKCNHCVTLSQAYTLLDTLPPPSAMKWKDAQHLLATPLSYPITMVTNRDQVTPDTISERIKANLQILSHVYNTTEMELSARVLIIILEVLQHYPTLRVVLQPKAADHPCFTDFIFLLVNKSKCDETPVLVTEVKKFGLMTTMAPKDEITAQVIHEH